MKQFLIDEALPLFVLTAVVTMMVVVAVVVLHKIKYMDDVEVVVSIEREV